MRFHGGDRRILECRMATLFIHVNIRKNGAGTIECSPWTLENAEYAVSTTRRQGVEGRNKGTGHELVCKNTSSADSCVNVLGLKCSEAAEAQDDNSVCR